MTILISSRAAVIDPVVARLGNVVLRRSDIRSLVTDRSSSGTPSSSPSASAVRQEAAIRAITAEAFAHAWDKRPDVVEEIERMRARIVAGRYLESVVSPPTDFPSEAALQAAYELNRETLNVAGQYHLAQIYMPFEPSAKAEQQDALARHVAEVAVKARSNNIAFGELARLHSRHAESAENDGDMGWVPEASLIPEIHAALATLHVDHASSPIRTIHGWHIVKLLGHQPARPAAFAEVRSLLVDSLRMARAEALERAYVERLMDQVVFEDRPSTIATP
ncbi:MAG: peptidylprolyl isomerase [Burkholderiales bacterium]